MIKFVRSIFAKIKYYIEQVFQKKPDHFIQRLEEQSTIMVEGTKALVDYMRKPNKKNAAQVRTLEKQADEVRRIMVDELNRTFVTPIDREDLYGLSRAIDDIIDHAYAAITEMDILNIEPNIYLQGMANILYDSSEKILLAIQRLELHPNVADGHALRARNISGQIEMLYAEALADLFKDADSLKDVVNMMKLRESYRNMFHAVKSTEQAANFISDIVVKFY
jgi:uncharacterized protein Yka (UPF0111/DUF47 family)